MRLAVALILAGSISCSSSSVGQPVVTSAPEQAPEHAGIAKLRGTTPPAWQVDHWLNSEPRSLESLRGLVVLVRWWTAGCPDCSTSAPALRVFHRDHGPKGLVVIGMDHHLHPGGGYIAGDPAYAELDRKIVALLAR